MAADKTSYSQSLTHMIKGNLGAGLLGMGSSFAHLGLVGALICLPTLCLISGYCVHLLIKSAHLLGARPPPPPQAENPKRTLDQSELGASTNTKTAAQSEHDEIDYPTLARRALAEGPVWMRGFSKPLGHLVDTALLVTQVGVCCVYIVFVVDNVTSILASYHIHISKSIAFVAIFPITLLLSFIRTLKKLALASMAANLLQFLGLALIVEFLVRDMSHVNLRERDNFRPLNEMALGFGSTMFAFEGISVVLPIYARMRRPKLMASHCGVVNVSFLVILTLYFIIGLLSFLKYGRNVRDSITLNLPAEPLYDLVRAMFTTSILLTYPLQFYVPNEMIWKWTKKNLLRPPMQVIPVVAEPIKSVPQQQQQFVRTVELIGPKHPGALHLDSATNKVAGKELQALGGACLTLGANEKQQFQMEQLIRSIQESKTSATTPTTAATQPATTLVGISDSRSSTSGEILCQDQQAGGEDELLRYEYYCRIIGVVITFTLAASVPKLNLLMDLIGSFSGAALSLTIPAIIHLAAFWHNTKGLAKCAIIVCDTLIIVLSLSAGMSGSISSMASIIRGH